MSSVETTPAQRGDKPRGPLKRIIKAMFAALGIEIRSYRPVYRPGCVALHPPGRRPRGHVLLAYILDPFLLRPSEGVSTRHTHDGESLLIAKVFLELNYAVDVVDYRNEEFIPRKSYDVFVSARDNFERMARYLRPSCIKVAHLDTAHFLFNNAAAYARALDLQRRRGVTCRSIRVIPQDSALECADYGALLGGDFQKSTYTYAGKPLYSLPIPAITRYPFPERKNFLTCHRRFLWFGSGGLVHKGLDLTLEAFAGLPELELWVCGPIDSDPEFKGIYRRELYETPNIRTLGWVDVTSARFTEIVDQCSALVFPSCSESTSASSITCMHAGLIPLLTREAGVPVEGFGRIFRAATIDGIRQTVREIAALPGAELETMARGAWEYARTTHTKERYLDAYRAMAHAILPPQ